MEQKIKLLFAIAFLMGMKTFAQDIKKLQTIQRKVPTGIAGVTKKTIATGSINGSLLFSRAASTLNGFGLEANSLNVFELKTPQNVGNSFSISTLTLGQKINEAVVENVKKYDYNSDTMYSYKISNLPLNKTFVLVFQRYHYTGQEGEPNMAEITNSAKGYNIDGAFFDCSTIYSDSKSILICTIDRPDILNYIKCVKISDTKIH